MRPWTLDSIHDIYSTEARAGDKSIMAGRELPPGDGQALQHPEEGQEEEEGAE